jgi:hypothetical protein
VSDQNAEMNAPLREETAPSPTIRVFVRLGNDEHERTIAFRIPDGMDPMDLLDRGATIDGNQAVLSVAWEPECGPDGAGGYVCPDLNVVNNGTWDEDFFGKSMTRVLGDCQRGVVKFFKERGYTVQFA